MGDRKFLTLRDASELLGVSYQTILKKRAEFGAVRIDAPGAIEYAVPAHFVREFLSVELEDLNARMERLNSNEFDDPFTLYNRADVAELEEREEEMLRLRFEKLWTLQEIADEYGLSRERVRQIIGNSGRGYKPKRIRRQARAMADKTNREVAEALGISYGLASTLRADIRTPVDGDGSASVGFDKEEWAAEHLRALGFDVELMPFRHPFDMLVNDSCRVDVKYCSTPRTPPSSGNISPQWCFALRGERENCDIYMCVTGEDDVFMIPSSEVPEQQEQLVFCYPTKRPSLGKYQKYLERYDLIKSYCRHALNGSNGHH